MADKQLAVISAVALASEAAVADTIVKRDASNNVALGNTATISAGLALTGFLKPTVQTKTSTFTIDEVVGATTNATIFLCDSTSGSVTANLPAVATSTGRVLIFVKTVSANSLIIDGASTETVNGATTKTSTGQYSIYAVVCDGTQWIAIIISGTWT